MKTNSIYFLFLIFTFFSCENNQEEVKLKYEKIEDYPVYDGDDLGFLFSPDQTTFKFWSPNAQDGRVFIYDKDDDSAIVSSHKMKMDKNGVWSVTVKENLEEKYYTFQVKRYNDWKNESPDPYTVACGRNGRRSQVLDFSQTN